MATTNFMTPTKPKIYLDKNDKFTMFIFGKKITIIF